LSSETLLPEPSSIQDAVRAATETVVEAQASQTVEDTPKPPFLSRPPVVVSVTVVFLGVVVWNILMLTRDPTALTPREEAIAYPATLFAVSQSVESFRTAHGRLPSSLLELGFSSEDFHYRVSGNEYVISAVGTEKIHEYQSSDGIKSVLDRMADVYGAGT